MSNKKTGDVWVSPRGKNWIVQQDGQTLSNHQTQDRAAEAGRREAKRDRVDLVIQRRDGQIRSKDSYGSDPNPPKDREH